ncbi:MAG: sigma 54-interacting transcriptional regulator, partial [Myxococcota bacterium]
EVSLSRALRLNVDRPKEIHPALSRPTNRDLGKMVAEGTFREDLYHRLMVVPVEIAPLRERPEDIVTLAKFILSKQEIPRQLTLKALEKLKTYEWPGNIRELVNALRRAMINTDHLVVRDTDIEFRPPCGANSSVGKLLHSEIISVFLQTESIAETAKRLSLRRPLVREHVELWKRQQKLKLD